jgi:hypothetical protein
MRFPANIPASCEAAGCHSGTPVWRQRLLWGGLFIAALGVLTLNWHWLVAVGAVPVLLGALPCAVMCLLHLCSGRKDGMQPDENRAVETPTLRPSNSRPAQGVST